MMKNIQNYIGLIAVSILMVFGACSNDVWDDLPSPIAHFITQYFPGSGVQTYSESPSGIYTVKINSGVTLKFDSDFEWTDIDANGNTLPEVLMYDQLPPALYSFLQSIEQTADVYQVRRDHKFYWLTMHDTVLTYNIQTEAITYPGQATSADPLM